MTGHLETAAARAVTTSPSTAAGINVRIGCLKCCPWFAKGFGLSDKISGISLSCKGAVLKGLGICAKKIYQCTRCIMPCCFKARVSPMTPVAPANPEGPQAAPARRKRSPPKPIYTSDLEAGRAEPASARSTQPLLTPKTPMQLPGQTDPEAQQ